jgi:hypothetical protein
MASSIFVVATNGTGLYYREVRDTDTTVYCDKEVTEFDTEAEAVAFCNAHDHEHYID